MTSYEERRENELERWESLNNGQTSNPEIWFEKGYDSGFADGVDLLPPVTIDELARKLHAQVYAYNNGGDGYVAGVSEEDDDLAVTVDGGVDFRAVAELAIEVLRGGGRSE